MLIDRIAHRYAKALYDLAVERKEEDSLYEESIALAKLYEDTPDFRVVLRSPVITAVRKMPIIRKIFEGKISTLMLDFLVLLTKRNREALLPLVLADLRDQYQKSHNITEARLVTANGMPEAQKEALKAQLEKQLKTSIIFKEQQDPRVIGGFEVQIGTALYDATVANSLRLIKREFTHQLSQ